jgi:cytoskeletal protein RodZ
LPTPENSLRSKRIPNRATMSNSPYTPFYDLFKLIVSILLLLIFLFLTLWMPSTQVPQSMLPYGTPLPARSTPTTVSAISFPTSTSTSIPSTTTNTPQATPSPTETSEQPPSPSPTPEPTPPPVVENPSNESACPATSQTQLQVGMKAIIRHRLNFRASAGIHNNRLSTNPPGMQVDVIGGPECTAYQNGSSYLWWQIKLPNGDIGWSAEASAFGGFYFMEPTQ